MDFNPFEGNNCRTSIKSEKNKNNGLATIAMTQRKLIKHIKASAFHNKKKCYEYLNTCLQENIFRNKTVGCISIIGLKILLH